MVGQIEPYKGIHNGRGFLIFQWDENNPLCEAVYNDE